MPGLRVCLFLLLSAACRLQAQESRAALMDTAAAFQRCDTARTIQCLEAYTKAYPIDKLNWLANVRLADLYKKKGPADSVLAKLTLAQAIPYARWEEGDFRPSGESFDRMIYARMVWARGNVSAELGGLYARMGQPAMALACLHQADSLYRRFNGQCGNDLHNCLSFLSIQYAELYLSMGDTTQAIHRLVTYCFSGESFSDQAMLKLRGLLLTRYSQEQLMDELDKSIQRSYYTTRKGDVGSTKYYRVKLFGGEPWTYARSRKELRDYFYQSRSYQLLKYGEVREVAVGK